MATKSTASAAQTAETKEGGVTAGTAAETRKTAPKAAESVYTAAELAENAGSLFSVRRECAAAALKAAGKDKATVSEARRTVEEFMKKEVK